MGWPSPTTWIPPKATPSEMMSWPRGRAPRSRAKGQRVALLEGPAVMAAELAAEIRGARAEGERRVDAAGDGEIRAYAGGGRPEPEDFAGLHLEGRPARHRRAVEGDGHGRARHRHPAFVRELEARTDDRALEARRIVGIAHEPVGEEEGLAIHGARGRDALAKGAAAAQVLHGGLWTRVVDEQVHRWRGVSMWVV